MEPDVTVVFLTKNGGADFRRALHGVMEQTLWPSAEALVIDSGSQDGTPEFAQQAGARVIRIPPEDFNYGTTKNLAVRESRGQTVVFLSQDNIPATSDWLKRLLSPLKDEVIAVQGGWVSESHGYYWWRSGGFFFTRETRRWVTEYGYGLSTCNLAIRKATLEAIPFRRVPMNEDKVLQRDLAAAGLSVADARDALVFHTHSYTLRALLLRLQNEGFGWRYARARYTFLDMILDTFSAKMWQRTVRATLGGEIRAVHEFFFPALRPLMVFKGRHFTRHYQWEHEV